MGTRALAHANHSEDLLLLSDPYCTFLMGRIREASDGPFFLEADCMVRVIGNELERTHRQQFDSL